MPSLRQLVVGAAALAVATPATAQAGTVDRLPGVSITYVGGGGGDESRLGG